MWTVGGACLSHSVLPTLPAVQGRGNRVSCSDVKLCPTVCDPMDCSTPGFAVHCQLPEFVQTHVHQVGDAIQPSHPLLASPPAFNLSQHQGFFSWVSPSHQVAKVLELQLQQSVLPMNIQDWFPLGLTGLIPLQIKYNLSIYYVPLKYSPQWKCSCDNAVEDIIFFYSQCAASW